MKIIPIPFNPDRKECERCENMTISSGTGYFPGEKYRCSKIAHYKIGRKKLCKLHAGDAALKYLLGKENGAKK